MGENSRITTMPSPDIKEIKEIKERIVFPIFLCTLPTILTLWWHLPLLVLLIFALCLLSWGWALFRVWSYHPSTNEKLPLIRNFQFLVTCLFFMILSLYAIAVALLVFHAFLLGWIFVILLILSLLGVCILAWQEYLLKISLRR